MNTRFRNAILVVCMAAMSCTGETPVDPEPSGQEITVVAELLQTKASFQEDGVSHCLKGTWDVGEEVFGFVFGGSAVSFTVSTVDSDSGLAHLTPSSSTSLSAGDKVYGIFCPGKGVGDLKGHTLQVDFSNQPADRLPVLMFAEGTVSQDNYLKLSFRNAVSVVGVVNPDIATPSSRDITEVVISGHNVVSLGVVSLNNNSLEFTPDIPSKFITKKIDLTVSSGKVDSPIYVVVPSCEIDRVTLCAGTFFYSWKAGKKIGVSEFCRADGENFSPLSYVPMTSGIEVNGTQWSISNFNISNSDDWGDCVKWADSKLIYSSKSQSSSDFVPLPGFGDGFVNKRGECYWDGSVFSKYNDTDKKTVLDPVDDIVQLTYPGTGWRMPTDVEWADLNSAATTGKLKASYSSHETTFSKDGYSIEFTRSFKGAMATALDQGAVYWTSSIVPGSASKAYGYTIKSSSGPNQKSCSRSLGLAVRPVRTIGVRKENFHAEEPLANRNVGASILSFPDWNAISVDYTDLTSENHPRLFLRRDDFNAIVNIVEDGTNPYLSTMHKLVLAAAEPMAMVSKFDKPIEYELDASGRRLLNVSRKALRKISMLAYAYRCTEDEKFLKMAEFLIKTVCEFPDWHPSHFLDVAEMATGVAIGYDWLYNELSPEVRTLAATRLKDYALQEGLSQNIYKKAGNWNQVCCGGMICSALAAYETCPSLSDEMIRRCLSSNAREIKDIYAPYGACPEGSGYWEYGTTYQGVINLALETALGTDFDLPEVEGFKYAGDYYDFMRDNTGHRVNYSDSGETDEASYGMWYMAYALKKPSYLYHDLYSLNTDYYAEEDYTFLALTCAYRMGNVTPTAPSGRMYTSEGANPVMACRTGWNYGDQFLFLKAGLPGIGHGHMDVGEIIYESDGTRWFKDFAYTTSYAEMENIWKSMGLTDDQTNYDPGSYRWKLCERNNRFHSTMTINDHDQWPYGTGRIYETFDDAAHGLGGSAELTNCYRGDLQTASRTAAIKDESWLEVTDRLTTIPGSGTTHVRWTCASDAAPTIVKDGIELSNGTVVKKLTTNAPDPQFKIWSSNPADYESEIKGVQNPLEGYLCGFEFDIPNGTETVIVTTLKKK